MRRFAAFRDREMRCDDEACGLELASGGGLVEDAKRMIRFLAVVPLLVGAASVSAQQVGHDACARDVTRFCRPVINDGDQAVLACLKEHRARLTKACDKVLTDHGQ